jgi:hypothetical protein
LDLVLPFFSLVNLLLVELVVKLEFFLAAYLVPSADVGLRQAVMGVGVGRFVPDSGLKLQDSFLIPLLVVEKDPELKMCVRQLRVH